LFELAPLQRGEWLAGVFLVLRRGRHGH
jgi:hypothetical protein